MKTILKLSPSMPPCLFADLRLSCHIQTKPKTQKSVMYTYKLRRLKPIYIWVFLLRCCCFRCVFYYLTFMRLEELVHLQSCLVVVLTFRKFHEFYLGRIFVAISIAYVISVAPLHHQTIAPMDPIHYAFFLHLLELFVLSQ